MSNLTRDDVLRLARLARLTLSDEEIDQFTTEISAILGYVEQLNKVDLAGTRPTDQVTGLVNVMRPDTVIDYGYQPKDLLKNVPEVQDDHIKVKRMLA